MFLKGKRFFHVLSFTALTPVFNMEIFKDITGYKGVYQVSNLGNVKSFKRNNEMLLKLSKNGSGYYYVGLAGMKYPI